MVATRVDAVAVVVVGGGHNGLVAAGYLARAGLRVRLLERLSGLAGLRCRRRRSRVSMPAYRDMYT